MKPRWMWLGEPGCNFVRGGNPIISPYNLSDKVIDWKSMWFYIRNLSSSLPFRTPGPPVKKSNWNSKGSGWDQVNFLLGEIEKLKVEHQICGASVIANWSMPRIQPLQRRVHFGFQYEGETDPSHYTRTKITEDDLKDQVLELLKNVPEVANVAGTFSVARRPREVLFRVVDWSVVRVLLVE